MPTRFYFTTGQAAQQLSTSQAQIRALCESGAVEAKTTPGGQYRIPAGELERLKRDGLPPIPRPLPDENKPAARNGRFRHGNLLLADPSSEVVSAVEEVAIAERQLEKRRLEHALEEEEDWFRARADEQAQCEAQQREAAGRRQVAADAERRREERDNRWLRYAMLIVPSDARGHVEQQIHDEVQAALDKIRLGEPATMAQRVVDATVAKILKPWRQRKDLAQALEDARLSLPYGMRGSWEPTTWESQACQAASKALDRVRPDASYTEMRAVAREAVKESVAAFELHRAAAEKASADQRAKRESDERSRKDRESREGLLRYLWVKFPYGMPDADQQAALAAARKAFAVLPEGTPAHDLETARDRAIKPYCDSQVRRKRKAELIAAGMEQIMPYVRKLEDEWDFEGKTVWMLCQEIREPIRAVLDSELVGDEMHEHVAQKVRRLVREELDIG